VIFLSAATRAALLPTVGFFVHGCPGAPFGFLLRNPAVLIAFLDMLSLSLLLVGVTGLVATRHDTPPVDRKYSV